MTRLFGYRNVGEVLFYDDFLTVDDVNVATDNFIYFNTVEVVDAIVVLCTFNCDVVNAGNGVVDRIHYDVFFGIFNVLHSETFFTKFCAYRGFFVCFNKECGVGGNLCAV